MAKKVPNKAKVKRPRRSRRVNKKIPMPMAHLGESLTLWGLDSREWLEDPLIWSSRGHPNVTMPIPSWGWFSFDQGRHHQVNQPYGTQLPEPDNTPSPSPATGAPNATSSQVPSDITSDLQGHSVPRHIYEPHGLYNTHHAVSNEGDNGTPPTSIYLPSPTLAQSLMLHDIMDNVENGDSSGSASTTTTPECFTPSDSLPYTTSPSSMGSGDQLDDATGIHSSAPSHMGSTSSNPGTSYDSSSSFTTFHSLQQLYVPSSAAQVSLSTGTAMFASTAYATQNPYLPHHQSTPSMGQSWPQSTAYLSYGDVDSLHPSAPPAQIIYSNMADHSLAPMIPYVSIIRNRRNTHNAPSNHDPSGGYSHGSNFAGPSRASRVSPSSSRSHHITGTAAYGLVRRAHTNPMHTSNSQVSRNIPTASSQLPMGTYYSWGTPHQGNGPNLTVNSLALTANLNANSATRSSGVGYARDSGSSDDMSRWDLGRRNPGFHPQ